MRSFESSWCAVLALVVAGCGSTIVVGEDGEGGESTTAGIVSVGTEATTGEGGATVTGTSGQTGPSGPTSSVASTGTGVVNPPDCPTSSPEGYGGASCTSEGLACTYAEEQGCTVTYACRIEEECWGTGTGTTAGPVTGTGTGYGGWGDDDGGYGGYGDDGGCDTYSWWEPVAGTCPGAVPCYEASDGDTCSVPGEYCSDYGDECSYVDKWCGEDHRWYVDEWYDECCYDDCCYDCECEPYYCPDTLPAYGDYCDPCYDSDFCSYEIETDCGTSYAYAYCSWDTYSWQVEYSGCSDTTGTGAGGWDGTGGGWEGTGGF